MTTVAVLRERLLGIARHQRLITYRDIAARIGLPLPFDLGVERQLERLMDELIEENKARREPLLTALIINAETKYPGKGLFPVLRSYRENFRDDLDLWTQEVARIYTYRKWER